MGNQRRPLTDKDGEVRLLDEEDMARFKPVSETHLASKLKRQVGDRGPQKSPTKVAVSLRLSPEVAEYFRSSGKGWQSRIDSILREYVDKNA